MRPLYHQGNTPGEVIPAEFALGGRETFRLPMGPVPRTITEQDPTEGDQQDADEADTETVVNACMHGIPKPRFLFTVLFIYLPSLPLSPSPLGS
jgi:hypothetical protein